MGFDNLDNNSCKTPGFENYSHNYNLMGFKTIKKIVYFAILGIFDMNLGVLRVLGSVKKCVEIVIQFMRCV